EPSPAISPMKPQLDRVKQDLDTIQNALGLTPPLMRDCVRWMRRDNWLNLCWCLPGVILICSALLPPAPGGRLLGLALGQWTGLLVAAAMLVITVACVRRGTRLDGRPASLIRDFKRVNGLTIQGAGLGLVLALELLLYFAWGEQFQVGFAAF